MTRDELKQALLDNVFTKTSSIYGKKCNDTWLKQNNLYEPLYTQTSFLPLSYGLKERIYIIIQNYHETPKCIQCGTSTLINSSGTGGELLNV